MLSNYGETFIFPHVWSVSYNLCTVYSQKHRIMIIFIWKISLDWYLATQSLFHVDPVGLGEEQLYLLQFSSQHRHL